MGQRDIEEGSGSYEKATAKIDYRSTENAADIEHVRHGAHVHNGKTPSPGEEADAGCWTVPIRPRATRRDGPSGEAPRSRSTYSGQGRRLADQLAEQQVVYQRSWPSRDRAGGERGARACGLRLYPSLGYEAMVPRASWVGVGCGGDTLAPRHSHASRDIRVRRGDLDSRHRRMNMDIRPSQAVSRLSTVQDQETERPRDPRRKHKLTAERCAAASLLHHPALVLRPPPFPVASPLSSRRVYPGACRGP